MDAASKEARLSAALADLVHQIDIAEYRDELGHPMKNNLAFMKAEALIQDYGLTHTRICEALGTCNDDMDVAARMLLDAERRQPATRVG